MTEYRAVCETFATETLTVRRAPSGRVSLCYTDGDEQSGSVFLSPSKAREFAAAVVAKADELEGVKDAPVPTVKVGSKLRVTVDRLNCAGVSVGDVLTVHRPNDFDGFSATDGRGVVWGFDLDHIGNGLEPLAAWELDLLHGGEPAPLTVGDRVRVVVDDPDERQGKFVGLTGELMSIDSSDGDSIPYLVRFGPGEHGDTDGAWYCAKVEKVVSDAPSAADVSFTPGDVSTIPVVFPDRVALLEEANRHIGQPARAEDVLAVARFLAGE
ncbi:hypothetical protein [Streptomyces niveus]|uniref:hypothetical protein n=1 Tax=Streptomyces niveus TaxID=193462 RepID=UPI0038650CD3